MASDAKPASPAHEDPPAGDAMDAEPTEEKEEAEAEAEEKDEAEAEAEEEEQQEGEEGEGEPQPRKKRARRRRRLPGEIRATPTPVERPSRERKTVERYSELTPRVTPSKKSPAILQGAGTKLKDIPNVSFKLSKRKTDENLQSLHTLLFGRKSTVQFLKRNISQFSGFVWMDNKDKQRTRMKEKLDKFNKEKLLDFCEILDIHSKTNARKEEVSAKLLEFLESPCVTRDVVLADKHIRKKRGRKSKGSGLGSAEGASEKKRRKVPKQAVETQTENDGEDDAGSEDVSMGEDDSEVKEHDESDEELDETPAKKKSTDDKQGTKEAGSKIKENNASGKQSSTKRAKALSKPSQHTQDEPDVELESKKAGKKSSKNSSKEINVPVDKANKKVSKSKKDEGKEGQSNNSVASNNKTRKKQGAKASNENKGKSKGSTDAMSAPTTKQLHAVVSDILKEVDFNTATLADILRQLGAHFNMDLMDRKSEVKRIIEEVINSMSDDEGEEENNEDDADNGKKDNSKEDPDEGDNK